MERFKRIAANIIVVAGISTAAVAQDVPADPGRGQPVDRLGGRGVRGYNGVNLSKVINARIFDDRGQELGTVRDVAVDSRRGRVAYALVSPTGAGSDEMFAVPWGAFHATGDGTVRINLAGGRFLTASRISEGDLSLLGDRTFGAELHRAYGQRPYWDAERRTNRTVTPGSMDRDLDTGSFSMVRGSELQGRQITNRRNENIGSINDMVIDANTGRVAYPVVSVGDFIGTRDDFVAMPWQQLEFGDDGTTRTDLGRDRLREAPRFDRSNPPQSTDVQFVNRVYDFYNAQPFMTADQDAGQGAEGQRTDAQRDDRNQPREQSPDQTRPAGPDPNQPNQGRNDDRNPNQGRGGQGGQGTGGQGQGGQGQGGQGQGGQGQGGQGQGGQGQGGRGDDRP